MRTSLAELLATAWGEVNGVAASPQRESHEPARGLRPTLVTQ